MALVVYNPPLLKEFHDSERTFSFSGLQPITIFQDWSNNGVAAVVWEAAIVLASYLLNMPSDIKGKNVLELGAGTGLTGIVAALLNANVTLTDQFEALKPLYINTKKNLNSNLHFYQVKELSWGEKLKTAWAHESYDYIIGADLVYIESALSALVATLEHFMEINRNLIIILSGKVRYPHKYEKFKKLLQISFISSEVFLNEDNVYILKIVCIK